MNEREELMLKFQKAMPLVEKLSKRENKFVKCTKTKGTLTKVIALFTFFVVFSFIVCISVKDMGGFFGFIKGAFIFYVPLAIAIFGYITNKKKLHENRIETQKILDSDELSFIPVSYLNSFDIIGIYKVLLDMRADTFKEAINVWEQDKHNMVMEAKPAVIVK